jgi:amidase
MAGARLAGRTAVEIAELVRTKEVTPAEVVRDHLRVIDARDGLLNAFREVNREDAHAQAEALEERGDLDDLPLAGVPIAVKDDADVGGIPTRWGSLATPSTPASADDPFVARLRAAGAIILGKTNVPEFMAWPYTESLAFGASRNPWHPAYTPGGSSGGAGAAVAAGMVPIAVGSDGLGSIRIPGSLCGLFGIKPGADVVPRPTRCGLDWFGLAEHGPLATTVADAALALDVMAGRSDLRDSTTSQRPLRIAVSTRAVLPWVVARPFVRAALGVSVAALRGEGHAVVEDQPPYGPPMEIATVLTKRWLGGIAADAELLPNAMLEPQTRTTVRLGRLIRRLQPIEDAEADVARARLNEWFRDYDALLLPTLPQGPLRIGAHRGRPWIWRYLSSVPYTAYLGIWNLVGFPTATVPAGVNRRGFPIGVQIVAPRGGEATVLAVARELERVRPWTRLAPRR